MHYCLCMHDAKHRLIPPQCALIQAGPEMGPPYSYNYYSRSPSHESSEHDISAAEGPEQDTDLANVLLSLGGK